MEEYKLEHWKRLTKYGSEMELSNADCYASLSCRISLDGKLVLKTYIGAGHGEPAIADKGRTIEDWMKLLKEAQRVYEFYHKRSN